MAVITPGQGERKHAGLGLWIWLVVAAALVIGALLGLLLHGPAERSPVVTAAVIVAGAVTYWVVNLWDSQDAARFERALAEDEVLISESRQLAARHKAER